MNDRFKYENIQSLMLKLAFPMVIAYLVQALYNVFDSVIISYTINEYAFSALGIIFPIQLILSTVSTLFAAGGSNLISISLGAGEKDSINKLNSITFFLAITVSVVFSILTYINIESLLYLFGAQDSFIDYAIDYLSIILIGIGFVAVNNTMNFLFRSKGLTKYGMHLMLIGVITNVILNPILIIYFNMGVQGAAIATVISQFMSMLYGLYRYYYQELGFIFSKFKLYDLKTLGINIVSVGAPTFIGTISFSLVVIISNVIVANNGTVQDLAAFNAIVKINELLVLPIFGLIAGLQPIVGYNFGQKNYDRVEECFNVGLKIIVRFLLGAMFIILIFPEVILGLFNINYGASYLQLSMLMFVFTGIQILSAQFLQSINHKKSATLLSISRHFFFYIPIVILVTLFFKEYYSDYVIYAVFISMALADLIAGLLALTIVKSKLKKLKKIIA